MKQCEHIDLKRVFVKDLQVPDGGFIHIDKSEWDDFSGVVWEKTQIPCLLAADEGHKYCPRHEMELEEERMNKTLGPGKVRA